jgi:pseudaminic acid synthase
MNINKTFIIAELSANHNNDFNLAVKTIQAIKNAGADAVKVQTYTADSLAMDVDNEFFGPKKDGLWKGLRPYDLYSEASMPYDWQPKLKRIAEDLGLVFFSSPFDKEAVDFLELIGNPIYKIASFEINDIPLIRYVASKGKPLIISTGVGDINDIKLAVDTCIGAGNQDITLLKCTSQYPAGIEDANMLTIPDMKHRFNLEVGVSDHSMGSVVPIVAVSLGAKVVEKHFILKRSLGGPDSAFSMEPDEFKLMVDEVRKVEKALGDISYTVSDADKFKRRSLFIVRDIRKGTSLSDLDIRSLRSGYGAEPRYLQELIGKKTTKDFKKGDPLDIRYLSD